MAITTSSDAREVPAPLGMAPVHEHKTVPRERAVTPKAATSTNERRENRVGPSVDIDVGAGADIVACADIGFVIGIGVGAGVVADIGVDMSFAIGADGGFANVAGVGMGVPLAFSWYY